VQPALTQNGTGFPVLYDIACPNLPGHRAPAGVFSLTSGAGRPMIAEGWSALLVGVHRALVALGYRVFSQRRIPLRVKP
jgi:hypothetical protein